MGNATMLQIIPINESNDAEPLAQPRRPWSGLASFGLRAGSALGWAFGLASLVLGLAIVSATPVLQFLSLGYLLESSARVARSGRLRDGIFGIRLAQRVGGMVAGVVLALLPLWLVASYASSASLVDPGGTVERNWRIAAVSVWGLTCLHILTALLRDGRLRRFLWPFNAPVWLWRRILVGGLYDEARDRFWNVIAEFQFPYFFRLGLVGFLGALVWLLPATAMIAATPRFPLLGVVGMVFLAFVASILPFLQTGYAVEGRATALFDLRSQRERFRRAPWAFALALFVLLAASIPLYLLKVEMIPREAAWLPGLAFILFLAPARLLVGWAYARSLRRHERSHWLFRLLGQLAIVIVAAVYVVVVFFSQYTSWGGAWSLFEQHAFLTPTPFFYFTR